MSKEQGASTCMSADAATASLRFVTAVTEPTMREKLPPRSCEERVPRFSSFCSRRFGSSRRPIHSGSSKMQRTKARDNLAIANASANVQNAYRSCSRGRTTRGSSPRDASRRRGRRPPRGSYAGSDITSNLSATCLDITRSGGLVVCAGSSCELR